MIEGSDCCIKVATVEQRVDKLEKSVSTLETVYTDIGDIKEIVQKIARYMKVAGPSIISAAIAAGIVNGKLGAFLHALFP